MGAHGFDGLVAPHPPRPPKLLNVDLSQLTLGDTLKKQIFYPTRESIICSTTRGTVHAGVMTDCRSC
jgi:hypothetical protein